MTQPATPQRILAQRTVSMMGTTVDVQVAGTDLQQRLAEQAIADCFDWLAEVEHCLTRFSSTSELSALNASQGTWFGASDILYTAVEAALWGARSSDGLFDPTLLTDLETLGYDRDFALIRHREVAIHEQRAGAPANGWTRIELDPDTRSIRLPEGVRLDLGGIAKGWAADVAMQMFFEPFAGALVNLGGDLRVTGGPADSQPWTVSILGTGGATQVAAGSARLSRGAMATSGAVERWWLRGNTPVHHLLDPRSRQPADLWTNGLPFTTDDQRTATVTAFAPTATRAEVAAKVAILRGLPSALTATEQQWSAYGPTAPIDNALAGVALLFVLGNGAVVASANLDDWLSTWGTATAPLRVSILQQSHSSARGDHP